MSSTLALIQLGSARLGRKSFKITPVRKIEHEFVCLNLGSQYFQISSEEEGGRKRRRCVIS